MQNIETELAKIKEEIAFLKSFLGVSQWMSPEKASKILPLNRNLIVKAIRESQKQESNKEKPLLKPGVHYYNATPDGERPTWKIHVENFKKAKGINS